MVKQAPTFMRLAAMVGFALSCFALLLYLWVAFGGPSPLKPKGYRFEVAFAEAALLANQADVRVAGVEVGKVASVVRRPGGGNATIATIELDPEYAPIASDARMILRQKAILGETYVDLTLGSRDAPRLEEGGTLASAQVEDTVELDEILDTYDPYTRKAFRSWQQGLGRAIRDRGPELSGALGNLPGFVEEGGDLFEVLDSERAALRALVRNTGVVFSSLTRREDQLRRLVVNSDTVLTAISSEADSFADLWNTFPTFLTESRTTFERLQRFAGDTRPVIRAMTPALENLRPALVNLGALSPDLERLYANLDPLITASRRSLPATTEILRALRPTLGELGPYLSELNPILAWLSQHQHTVSDIFANLGGATGAKGLPSTDPGATGHYLRQFGPTGTETVAVYPNRLASNRGNSYPNPLAFVNPEISAKSILPAWDCKNAGGPGPNGEKDATEGAQGSPACFLQDPFTFRGETRKFPHIERFDYSE
jgi:phospholipid/cholesterol/gamma-HCH transport system substrate-binding protein